MKIKIMNKKRIKIIILSAIGIVLVLLIVWMAWSNSALELNSYSVASSSLPKAFDGFRIAHISDLHNTEMGKDNEKLRERNHQLKATGESQVASLITCEEAVITYSGRQER